MTRRTAPRLERGVQRQLAVDLFNHVWTLIEKESRTPDDDDRMLHAAHASRYHWGEVGEPVNFARGEWQVSRVYAVLGRAEPSLWHAQRCLDICHEHGIGDFDLAYAYEALARANAVAGRRDDIERYRALASDAGTRIAEADDREHFEGDQATIR